MTAWGFNIKEENTHLERKDFEEGTSPDHLFNFQAFEPRFIATAFSDTMFCNHL
jgi:hypothetical protein